MIRWSALSWLDFHPKRLRLQVRSTVLTARIMNLDRSLASLIQEVEFPYRMVLTHNLELARLLISSFLVDG